LAAKPRSDPAAPARTYLRLHPSPKPNGSLSWSSNPSGALVSRGRGRVGGLFLGRGHGRPGGRDAAAGEEERGQHGEHGEPGRPPERLAEGLGQRVAAGDRRLQDDGAIATPNEPPNEPQTCWLMRVCVQRGYRRFEWSVLDWNEPSIRFYRSIGAVGMDEWKTQRLSGDALTRLATS
jgi:hypothetical protein